MPNKNAGFIGVVVFLIALAAGVYYYLQYSAAHDTSEPSTAIITDVTVTSSRGDEQKHIGQTYTVTWNATDAKKVNIVLMNGTRTYGAQNAEPIDATAGIYSWTVPDVSNFYNGTGGGYLIVVEENRENGTKAESAPFVITR
jgi:hypothetical protein